MNLTFLLYFFFPCLTNEGRRLYFSFCFSEKKIFFRPYLVNSIDKTDQSRSSQLCLSKHKNLSYSQLSAKTPDCAASDTKMFVGFKFLTNRHCLKPTSHVRVLHNIFTKQKIMVNLFSLTLLRFAQGQLVFWRRTFSMTSRKSWVGWTKSTNRNLSFLLSVAFYKNMGANSEASLNKENFIAWSLEMEALFIKQIRYRKFLWNIKSSLYLKEKKTNTQYAL